MDKEGSVSVAVVSWDDLGIPVLQPKRVSRPRRD